MKKLNLFVTITALLLVGQNFAQTALVQFIHNSGDASLQTIDIYLDDILLQPSLGYHQASAYLEVPAETEVDLAIAPAGSVSASEAVISTSFTFGADQMAVAVVNGLISDSGYSPMVPATIHVFTNSSAASAEPNEVEMLFVHGSTDLPMISLQLEGEPMEWVSDLFFGQYSQGYQALDEANYFINMLDVSNNVFEQFELPLQNYGLAGTAVTAVIGGFNNPENNFMGESLAIWLALPEGGMMLECPLYPMMQIVDVYVSGELILDDFNFLTSTPFIDVQAGVYLEMLIAPDSSTSDAEAFISLPFYLNAESDYVLTIHGNLDNVGFYPYEPLSLNVFEGALTTGLAGASANLLFINACTDMPTAHIHESELLQLDFAQDWMFGQNEGYFEILTADYVFELRDPSTNTAWASYVLPLTTYTLGSDAVNVVACGYVNPAANTNGETFSLYAALYAGGPMIPLIANTDVPTSEVQFINNSPDPQLEMIDVYINGAKWIDDLNYLHASAFISLPVIDEAIISVTANNAMSAEEGSSWNINMQMGERYILTLNGFLNGEAFNPNLPLTLHTQENINAQIPSGYTAFTLLNGSTDGPSFYTSLTSDGSELIGNLPFGASSLGSIELPTTDFGLDLNLSSNNSLYKSFGFPALAWNLNGQSVALIAAGFNNPIENNEGLPFGLWLAHAQGGPLMELPEQITPTFQARAQFIHGSADISLAEMDVYMNGALIADNWAFREATAFIDVPAEVNVLFSFAPATSSGPVDAWWQVNKVFSADETYYCIANGLMNASGYNPFQPFDLSLFNGALESSSDGDQTSVVFYHGSTDTPGLDASEITVPMPGILDNLMFDGFGGYLSLPSSVDYALDVSVVNGNSLGQFGLPLQSANLEGQSILVFATGFLNPNNNNDGMPLQFYAARANGVTFPLTEYVGINEQKWIKSLSLYPNPTAEILHLHLSLEESEFVDLELIDINGKVVFLERNLQKGKSWSHTMDVHSLPEGYYFLRIKNRQLVETIGFGIIR
jgi:hypothetical protein